MKVQKLMRTKHEQHKTPFDLKLCLVSFLVGAFFVLMPFLYLTYVCLRHSQAETTLRNQLLTERYNNQMQMPALPLASADGAFRDFTGFERGVTPLHQSTQAPILSNFIVHIAPIQPLRIPKYPPTTQYRGTRGRIAPPSQL